MRLLDELVAEHTRIDAVVGSLRAYVALRLAGGGDPDDGSRFVRVLRQYAGEFHHAREEDTLFVALRDRAELPDAGPLAVLCGDHRRTGAMLDRMAPLLARPVLDHGEQAVLEQTAIAYSRLLWHHIDAENSVLFPEEAEAMAIGDALVARYPPLMDRGIVRGDGCVCCPALVDNCPGLERAWWSESEWDELEDHLAEG
jgi:hemerythrin-like domain-containing protein